MKLNVTRGYRGALTNNQHLDIGEYDLDDPLASLLIRKGFATIIPDNKPRVVKLNVVEDAPQIWSDNMPPVGLNPSVTKPARRMMRANGLTKGDFPGESIISKPMVDAYLITRLINDKDE